jgi:predicted permease
MPKRFREVTFGPSGSNLEGDMVKDLRYALRSLRRVPGFTLTVVTTLGLGIGANTAIFSVIRGVMLKPLPHRDGERLVYLKQSVGGPGGDNIRFSVPEILDFREQAKSFAGIAEYSGLTLTMTGDKDAQRINVGLVTGNYFEVMGLSQVLGRLTSGADDGTGVPPVMVLTHEFWIRRFGGDSAIVGKTLRIANQAVTVIGVLEPAPFFPERMDALMNMVISEHHTSAMMVQGRTHRMTDMIARLKGDASVARARGEVTDIRKKVQGQYPDAYDAASNYTVSVIPFQEVLGSGARLTLLLLMGAAGFVLIIAAANVTNLTLMRGVRREQELVIRSALGAGSGALRRLLFAENALLALAGSALGLVVAYGGIGMLTSLAARYSSRASEIALDGPVLAFALGLAAVVAIILSFAPRFVDDSALGAWLTGAGKSSAGRRRQRLQRGLVVAQVAVSVVLLTGAGLLTRTVRELSQVDTGFDADDVLTLEVPLDFIGRSTADLKAQYERMQAALVRLPGVTDVAITSSVPLRTGLGVMLDVKAEGRPLAAGEPMPRAVYRSVSPEYFRAVGVRLLSGRPFESTDRDEGGKVVILNKTLADQFFPGKEPIGQRIAWTGDVLRFIGVSGDWRTVVGVVADTKENELQGAPPPVVFMPSAQDVFPSGGLVVRARGDAAQMAGLVTKTVRDLAPEAPIEHVMTVRQTKAESIAPQRLNATLVAAFGLLAILIAAVGIAGVLAFSVSARTNEIGIRMSLGAASGQVLGMILAEGGVLLAGGLGVGVIVALLATRSIEGLLFQVKTFDPATLGLVALVMSAVGVLAAWVPAVRASKIDPAVAIRRE